MGKFRDLMYELLVHFSLSTVLSQFDFHLFRNLDELLARKRFGTNEDAIVLERYLLENTHSALE